MSSNQPPGRPGWYNDPEGVYQHQAYWDGQRWTGQTRRQTAPVDRWVKWVAILIGVAVVAFLVLMALAWGLLEIVLAE